MVADRNGDDNNLLNNSREMNITDELRSIEFDKNKEHIFGIKSAILWGHREKGATSPLLYISKPKHISQEDFDYLIDHLDLQLRR